MKYNLILVINLIFFSSIECQVNYFSKYVEMGSEIVPTIAMCEDPVSSEIYWAIPGKENGISFTIFKHLNSEGEELASVQIPNESKIGEFDLFRTSYLMYLEKDTLFLYGLSWREGSFGYFVSKLNKYFDIISSDFYPISFESPIPGNIEQFGDEVYSVTANSNNNQIDSIYCIKFNKNGMKIKEVYTSNKYNTQTFKISDLAENLSKDSLFLMDGRNLISIDKKTLNFKKVKTISSIELGYESKNSILLTSEVSFSNDTIYTLKKYDLNNYQLEKSKNVGVKNIFGFHHLANFNAIQFSTDSTFYFTGFSRSSSDSGSTIFIGKYDIGLNRIFELFVPSLDKNYYAYSSLATTDGGLLLTGTYDNANTNKRGSFLWKIGKNGEFGTLSKSHPTGKSNLNLRPSFASNQITVVLLKSGLARIFSIDGQLHMIKFLENGNNSIDISSLSSGVYFISVESENRNYQIGKFVKN